MSYFSEFINKSFPWVCDLCEKTVVYIPVEQNGQPCLCGQCLRTELDAESKMQDILSYQS